MRRHDGSITELGAPSLPLGLFPDTRIATLDGILGPGDVLLLYTDGASEARTPDGAFAPTLLEDALTGAGTPEQADQAVVAAVERVESGRGPRRPGPRRARAAARAGRPSHDDPPLTASDQFAPVPEAAGAARRFTVDVLRHWDRLDLKGDGLTVVSELATNAYLHAHSPFTMTMTQLDDAVRVAVDDSPLPAVARHYGSQSATGRGVRLVAAFVAALGDDAEARRPARQGRVGGDRRRCSGRVVRHRPCRAGRGRRTAVTAWLDELVLEPGPPWHHLVQPGAVSSPA